MPQAPVRKRAPDPGFSAAPAIAEGAQHVGVTSVCGARPVRILLIDHGAEDVALAELLAPWSRVTVASSLGDSARSYDVSVFEGVVLGAHGPPGGKGRSAAAGFEDEGYAGAILATYASA